MKKQLAKRQPLNSKEALILDLLRKDRRPHSAYDLIDKLRDSGVIAPATVYRALQRLIDKGQVHRIESLNAFLACSHNECHQHTSSLFAICDDCGNVEELSDPVVTAPARKWAKANSFALQSTMFELRGTCAQCAARTPSDRGDLSS